MTSNVIDSNMFIRSVVLSREKFLSEKTYDLTNCKLASYICRWEHKIYLMYKLITAIAVENLTQVWHVGTIYVVILFSDVSTWFLDVSAWFSDIGTWFNDAVIWLLDIDVGKRCRNYLSQLINISLYSYPSFISNWTLWVQNFLAILCCVKIFMLFFTKSKFPQINFHLFRDFRDLQFPENKIIFLRVLYVIYFFFLG